MTHCFLTIAIPIDDARVAATNAALDEMGNPAIRDIREKLREDLQIHFLSIGAISGDGAAKGHLVFEASSDASARDTIATIATRLDPWLQPVFAAAGLRATEPRRPARPARGRNRPGLVRQSRAQPYRHAGHDRQAHPRRI